MGIVSLVPLLSMHLLEMLLIRCKTDVTGNEH
jgi:hypothetical protein